MLKTLSRLISYKLYTPGPLSTTSTVKDSMKNDLCFNKSFNKDINHIRNQLLKISNLPTEEYTSLLLPGSGTFGVESTLRTAVNQHQKILIAVNGAYGERMVKICKILKIPTKVINIDERKIINIKDVLYYLDTEVTHFAMVHSETTTGILNPIDEISSILKKARPDIKIIGDCVSSFGAVDTDFSNLDFIVTCSNKLLQGVPGLALIIAKNTTLDRCEGNAKSSVLDLFKISRTYNHFVVIPPYQSISALKKAIEEFWKEGGVKARQARYQKNQRALANGMNELGFKHYIDDGDQGWIISTFIEPKHYNYSFEKLYKFLADRGIIIYPGKLSKLPTFRIGTIGELYKEDMIECVKCIKEAFEFMRIPLPLNE
ncbi:hypothetical protein SteCoe_2253 [Stentor coeruleus]|uniref:Aminotransferase class V domain-containing protein n=1 Tax=Stentor coeruleus TaxID=5963 RepID=A0A1R2D024_9CILI|nr:hypothetical protein SteCoe_2253 [Stentor coeruleus]